MNEKTPVYYVSIVDPALRPGFEALMRVSFQGGATEILRIPPLDTFRQFMERPDVLAVEFL